MVDVNSKTIIFFDGDGTLWYPTKTKHTVKPHWIYSDKTIKVPEHHLVLTPTALSTLKALHKKGVLLVVLSTHPHKKEEAQKLLAKKLTYFHLEEFFTEIHATQEHYDSKGEYIVEILKRLKIPKTQALMVGDNYLWDYKSARNIGVDALLVQSDYMKKDKRLKILKKLSNLVH